MPPRSQIIHKSSSPFYLSQKDVHDVLKPEWCGKEPECHSQELEQSILGAHAQKRNRFGTDRDVMIPCLDIHDAKEWEAPARVQLTLDVLHGIPWVVGVGIQVHEVYA